MANSLKCDICGKPATVHLTQIIDSKVHKMHLCESCAQTKGVTDPSGFSLADLVLKASLNVEPGSTAGLKCVCGLTQQDFKKHGRFGCPACYTTFKSLVDPMLGGMHKGVCHTGKVPKHAMSRQSIYDKLTQLQTELEAAIKSERYEDAARFRDEIHQVKESIGNSNQA